MTSTKSEFWTAAVIFAEKHGLEAAAVTAEKLHDAREAGHFGDILTWREAARRLPLILATQLPRRLECDLRDTSCWVTLAFVSWSRAHEHQDRNFYSDSSFHPVDGVDRARKCAGSTPLRLLEARQCDQGSL